MTGETKSTNFPPEKPFQNIMAGVSDVFVSKISDASCSAALSSDSATSEVAADLLVLANAMPRAGSEISGAQLKRDGMKVTANYILESRDAAILDVKLLDQAGNIRGDGGSHPVSKFAGCPPPEGTPIEIVLPREGLDLTPRIGGVEATSLKLRARLTDSGGALLKTAEVLYIVLPDAISIADMPKINGQNAPNGSPLPANGKVNFNSRLRYHLTNDLKGNIRLQAFNESGGALLASKEVGDVMATEQPITWPVPLDFQFDVLPSVVQIRIVASLLAENGSVLKSSTPLLYHNKLRIELGTHYRNPSNPQEFSAFNPFGPRDSYIAGTIYYSTFFYDSPLAIKMKDDLPASLNDSLFELVLTERLNDGTLIRTQGQVEVKRDPFPRPSFRGLGPGEPKVQDDVDKWEFQLIVHPPNNAPRIESEIVALPITRIRIISANPLSHLRLVAGTSQDFDYLVAYHNPEGEGTINAKVTYVDLSAPPRTERISFPNETKPVGAGSRGESFKFTLNLPQNLQILRVVFSLDFKRTGTGDADCDSKQKTYLQVDRPPGTAPAGGPQTLGGPGVDVNIIQNNSPRTIKPGRNSKSPKIDVEKDIWSLPRRPPLSSEDQFLIGTSVPTLTTASLFKDFIGLNATWQFEPPIPADGSFIADLKFYYSADDFPDDPNFSEAALKIIGFDPSTGVLEAHPTTVDLNAKTATARVNGLMPRYSVGVFGPFAQQTLNFPILRSIDDFTTQLNFASIGATPANLMLRAFSPTGEVPTGSGVVNPLHATLPAARTMSSLAGALFGFPIPFDGGWIQTRVDKNFIAGYQILGQGQRLDGLGFPAFYASTLVLTNIQYDTAWTTEVHLANVTRFPTSLTLELRTATGILAEKYETSLAPKETFARRLQDIFPTVTQPFTGYVIVRADTDLAAAVLLVSATEIVALSGQTPIVSSAAPKLYAPYVLTDGNSVTTRLNLVNPTTSTANLTLRFVNQTGANVAAPAILQLAAGQQSQREVAQIFSLSPGNLIYGSLIIESSITGVVGDVSYSSPSAQFKFRAALPLENEPAKFFAFAHLDNRNDSFTDVGIFNPGAQAAQVQVRVLRADGTETGKTTVSVPAGAHYSDFLDTIVAASFGQLGGSFTLSSDQPIVTGAAFGSLSGTTLSALAAQSFDPSTFTRANASVSAANYRGPDLAAESIVAAFGANLATATQVAATLPLPIEMAGTTVRVRDIARVERLAPLFFVSTGQINYQLPPGTAAGAATVTISSGDGALSTGAINVTGVAPGVFAADSTGTGLAAAYIVRVRNDNSLTQEFISRYDDVQKKFVAIPVEFNAQTQKIVLVLFGTGWRGRTAQSAVGVKIGGTDVPVEYAGAQGGFVGLDQMNVDLLRSLIGRGEIDIAVTVDGKVANTVRINVK